MEFPAKWSGFWILWFLFANATVQDCEKTKGYLQGNLNLFREKEKAAACWYIGLPTFEKVRKS
jgi:hypothetical protein